MAPRVSRSLGAWKTLFMRSSNALVTSIQMPILQSADLWRESGRYDDYGQEMLRMKDRHDRDLLFTPTVEELVTDILEVI